MNHDAASGQLERFLDCGLTAEERDEVALHLASCPSCQEQLATVARLRGMVRARLATAAAPPPDLAERIRFQLAARAPVAAPEPVATAGSKQAVAPPVRRRWWIGPARPDYAIAGAIGVVVLALAVGGTLLRVGWTTASAPDIAGEIATQHLLFALDDQLLEVKGGADAVVRWFSEQVEIPVVAPSVPGYTLQGGRLVEIDGQRAALVIYEHEPSERYLSLVVAPADTSVPAGLRAVGRFSVGTRGEVAVVSWSTAETRVSLVAPLTELELLDLAEQIAGDTDRE